MTATEDVADRLRIRILRGLHVGQLQAGDRLQGTRAAAARLGVDHRTVARAYRLLAEEGLVEIRPRSGVYVAPQENLGGGSLDLLAGSVRWIRDVAAEGWLRHIPATELPELLDRCLASRGLTCACVESVTDAGEAIADEVRRGLGVPTRAVMLPDGNCLGSPPKAFRRALCEADLIVTTVFHAGIVESYLARWRADRPLVVVSISQEWCRPFQDAIRCGGLTVVSVHPEFPQRLRLVLGATEEDRLRFLPVEQFQEAGADSVEGSLYFTVAARRVLGAQNLETVTLPGVPLLSRAAVVAVTEAVIRVNLGLGRTVRTAPDRLPPGVG